jgi:FkbM family methyltransferase
MSALDRLVGLARSMVIYHGIPWRQREMRKLYRSFVEAGDVAFDIGAHAGNRTRGLAALGCRVIAVEPQPDFARLLRLLFGRSPRIEIVEAAIGAQAGKASLAISERTPTVTTVAAEWRDARSHEPEFDGVHWNRSLVVETTTLDLLIAQWGMPAFVKIDVEGAEPAVLAGLTRAVPVISFEYVPSAPGEVRACVERVRALGSYLFNWSVGESFKLESETWLSGDELMAALETPRGRQRSGDVYARLSV